jgi:hypothetical protein
MKHRWHRSVSNPNPIVHRFVMETSLAKFPSSDCATWREHRETSPQTFLQLAAGAVVLPSLSRQEWQAYPTRPIRLVVPFPPGGAFDAVGRPWAEKMKPLLGTLVVENIGGGALR